MNPFSELEKGCRVSFDIPVHNRAIGIGKTYPEQTVTGTYIGIAGGHVIIKSNDKRFGEMILDYPMNLIYNLQLIKNPR